MARGIRNKKIEATEAVQVLEAAKAFDTTTVISDVNNLQVKVQGTLADLAGSITSKVAQANTLDQAIQLKQYRLKELYEIEADAIKWDDISAQHLADRATWDKEKDEAEALFNAEERQREQERQRKEEEWNYAFAQRKKRSEADEQQRIDLLNRNWDEREIALKAQEKTVADLKAQVDALPVTIKKEVDKAEAILRATMDRQAKHEAALLQKDAETARVLADAQKASAAATITSLQAQNEELRGQLTRALADAKAVAERALESASDRRVSEALRQVMDGRDQQPSKKN